MSARVCGDDRDPYVRILDALALHKSHWVLGRIECCETCSGRWPCDTVRALTGDGRYPGGDDRQVTP